MPLYICYFKSVDLKTPTTKIYMMPTQNTSQNYRKIFARKLREQRLLKGISQEELADLSGLHRTYVGSVERGERNVSIDNMGRLACALGIQLKELLTE